MKLETGECIYIDSNNRIFTDCMEFSLLRFTQLMMVTDNFKYPTNIYNKYLMNHISKYPNIYKSIDKYYDNNERSCWAINVSDKNFFDYYRNDMAELFTSKLNIMKYFQYYLDIDVNYDNFQETFNKVAKKFCRDNRYISIDIEKATVNKSKMNMSNIIDYISRPDNDEYNQYIDEDFIVIDRNSIIKIYINDDVYTWSLWEKFIDDSKSNNKLKNKFITGHSVISS